MTNRIIKFRAWLENLKEMKYDVGIHPHIAEAHDDGSLTICPSLNTGIVLMQFTGLLDKNGKEIYEGDILHWYMYKDNGYKDQLIDENLEVRMSNGAWRAGRNEKTFWHEIANMEKEIEIIGNIYENPDLLK